MDPRLPSSRQWTQFPAELITQMKNVFQEGFKGQLGKAQVEVEGRIYPSELMLSLGFSRSHQLKQPNFEISLTYDPKRDNVLKLMHLLFDAMGALFDQYFQTDDDSEFPLYWEQMEFEGKQLYVQYSTRNSKLEEDADKILGTSQSGLMKQDSEDAEKELEEIKSQLGLSDDDPEQPS